MARLVRQFGYQHVAGLARTALEKDRPFELAVIGAYIAASGNERGGLLVEWPY